MGHASRFTVAAILVAVLAATATSKTCYALSYAIAPFGPRGWISSAGYAISASGMVVGVGGDMEPPAIFLGGTPYYQIPGPDDQPTPGFAYGVIGNTLSDAQVVGQMMSPMGALPFFYRDGVASYLTLPGIPLGNWVVGAAQGINRIGDVVGWMYNFEDPYSVQGGAFLYHSGTMTNLDPHGTAWGINDSGQIVGSFSGGYLYSDGQSSKPGQFPGVDAYVGRAINSHGDIAGSARFPDGDHAFAYIGGRMIDFGPGTAEGINNNGEVVGTLWDATSYTPQHAFLYTGPETDRVYTLASLVPNDNFVGPFDILDASAINDAGQITGEARFLDFGGAFVMTPTPEPSAAGLMASALAVLTLFAARRRSLRRPAISAHPR